MSNARLIPISLAVLAAGCSSPRQQPVLAASPGASCAFLAVGRQGYALRSTRRVAAGMERVARERGDVNFAVLLGDNFYPMGVRSVADPQWQRKFEALYAGPNLRGMPFYGILGNHDHQGNVDAQLEYSRRQLGSGRWKMRAPFDVREFGVCGGGPLLRVVFLDSVALSGLGTWGAIPPVELSRDQQLQFLRSAFSADGVQARWKIVAAHYPARSATQLADSARRTMDALLPVLEETGVDLFISSNDRFQQILIDEGGLMHVATNGGGRKLEPIATLDTPSALVVSQRGFALVSANASRLKVELFDADGGLSHTREKTAVDSER